MTPQKRRELSVLEAFLRELADPLDPLRSPQMDDLQLGEVMLRSGSQPCVDWNDPAHRSESWGPRTFQVIRAADGAFTFEEC